MLAAPWPAWTHAVVLLLVSPLLEEAVFRAGLQEWLLRRGAAPVRANLSTALAFGAAHALLRMQWVALAVTLPALLIGGAYGRSRALRWCVLMHAAMNGVWLWWATLPGGG